VAPVAALSVVRADSDDDRIVECSTAARTDYIITGDKHLLALGSHSNTRIIKPAEFLTLSPDG
jgi:predicted nucleic acid-binding protein